MSKTDSLYITIYNFLKENIKKNCYSNGTRLPTEMELAKQFYVSRITTKKALNVLAEEGLIVRIPGKGSYTKESYQSRGGVVSNAVTRTITLVMGGYSSSFGLDILNGVMDAADRLSLNMIIKATYSSQEKEAHTINSLMSSGVDGIIVQPSQGELYSETLLRAVYNGYPIVMIDRTMQGINVPFVGVDNTQLSFYATEKLLKSNHRNIALLAFADEKSSTIKERMDGFAKAFLENGIMINKSLFFTNINDRLHFAGLTSESDGAYEFYVDEIHRFLLEHPEVTAVFGTEYAVSKAAHDAIRRIGRRVPDDISLVSFDMDSSYMGLHRMSYIKQPQRQMGIKACELLNDIINNRSIDEINCIMPGEWIDGNSIKKL